MPLTSRPTWRWAATAALVAGLVGLPSAAHLLPADAAAPAATVLLQRVQRSQDVGWSGYGESSGTLALPDVRELSGLPALFGGTTRTRTWWRGATDARVDTVTSTGETDVVVDPAGSWTWDSGDRSAVRLTGEPAVRLPAGADLVAPVLGRRLARTPGVAVRPLPGRRVAGRATAGLRLTPPTGSATTVQRVDLWADPATGLVLAVDVVPTGSPVPALRATLLDLDLSRPSAARTAFSPPADARVQEVDAPDLAAAIDRFFTTPLPATLAGQPRRDRVEGLSGGIGTYGEGLTTLAVVPLPRGVGRSALRRVDPTDTDGRADVQTPLVSAVLADVGGRVYLLAGTVPPAVLDSALAQLRADPPRTRRR